MGENSAIQWTHHTFNPWMGCAKAHAGCTNCYAEKALPVSIRPGGPLKWGEVWQGGERVVKADSGWREPLKWARDAAKEGERRRVFCSSLADVLEVPPLPPPGIDATLYRQGVERVETARGEMHRARERVWETIWATARMCPECGPTLEAGHDFGCKMAEVPAMDPRPGLDWLLLTKRPENWRVVPEHIRPLVWLGTSISDQKTADEWVPRLLDAEGFRLRFLSVEPLVGPVDLSRWLPGGRWYMARCRDCGYTGSTATFREVQYDGDADVACPKCSSLKNDDDVTLRIGWVIVGGESGPKARPCDVEWVRDIVRQCREVGVPCFVKQLGYRATDERNGLAGAGLAVPPEALPLVSRRLKDKHGGDTAEWPEDLRVQAFPEVAHVS